MTEGKAGAKVRENRVRRKAARQGLLLQKSRLRDQDAHGYGTYMLVNGSTNAVDFANWNAPNGYGLTLDDVEGYLSGH